ncbi:MAG: hypothetical protein R8P61_33685 [Bacteroidia bacterium]|nr:hypothetical protein [Bacteroidia bacterium]
MDRKQKLNKPLLALILVSVLFIPAVFIYMAMKKDADQEALQAELQHEIASLEGSLLELNEMNEHSGRARDRAEMDAELKKQQLEEMAFKLNNLEDKVAQMAKDNQANEVLIKELKEKLAKAKSALVENYKKEIDLLFTDNVNLSQMGDSLKQALILKDSLCRMKEKDLGLKPWLKAENISFIGLKGDKTESGDAFKKNRIQTLKVQFDLIGMGPVPNNSKQIFMIIESAGKQTLQDASRSASWFNFKGQDIPYSSRVKVDYAGTPLKIDMFFDPAGGTFNSGIYQVKFFSETEFIGQKQVNII